MEINLAIYFLVCLFLRIKKRNIEHLLLLYRLYYDHHFLIIFLIIVASETETGSDEVSDQPTHVGHQHHLKIQCEGMYYTVP